MEAEHKLIFLVVLTKCISPLLKQLRYLYFVSLSLVLVGVLLFSMSPTPLGCIVNMRIANQRLHSRLSVAVQLDVDHPESEALRPGDSYLANGNHYHYPQINQQRSVDLVQSPRLTEYNLLR